MAPQRARRHAALEVLVAEDSPTQAEVLRQLLERNGYAVTTAANGKQAIEAARKRKPTLVISDIVMPEMDGYALCKAIKANGKLKDVPVILVTSLSGIQDIALGLDCGADNFIRKPYDQDALLSRIDYLLSNRKLRKSMKMQMGLEIFLAGKRYFINSEREQILDLLVSSYEDAILLNEDLKRREREVVGLNSDLKQRAVELEAANKELEQFNYSVSHDLRAPLRHIEQFSWLLQQEQGERLEEEGKRYLRRVRDAAQRMSQLIDDMLRLSRVTLAEMQREDTDLAAIAREIIADLRRADPGRAVEFKARQDVTARCDPRLVRIALENLLGNAWKFTGIRDAAAIEFGMVERSGERTYFVRDNGAGFDMKHVHRLFNPFRRLHSADEFPGTGIGLATVQRIVHRHGGAISAEAVVDQGATFFFTL